MSDDLVGLRRAAQLADRSERTIRRWIDEGKMQAFALPQSNRLLIRRTDLAYVLVSEPAPSEPPKD